MSRHAVQPRPKYCPASRQTFDLSGGLHSSAATSLISRSPACMRRGENTCQPPPLRMRSVLVARSINITDLYRHDQNRLLCRSRVTLRSDRMALVMPARNRTCICRLREFLVPLKPSASASQSACRRSTHEPPDFAPSSTRAAPATSSLCSALVPQH